MLFFPREIRSVLSGSQQLRERPSVGVRVRPEGLVGWPEYRWWPVILNTGHADSREHTLSPAGSDELMMRENWIKTDANPRQPDTIFLLLHLFESALYKRFQETV